MELNSLPSSNWLSANICNRWSGILNVDGKYVKVKGYEKKTPFIYGIDFFQIVISDDISPLKQALFKVYPKAKTQLCHTHYLENIRQDLRIRTEEKYQSFFYELITKVFTSTDDLKTKLNALFYLYNKYAKDNPILQYILIQINNRQKELFNYQTINYCPRTNNIIESFNSHLQGRLKSIKGFKSFHSADRWLNAWMIRRRTKPYTDCQGMFKKYNSKMPLEMSIKKQAKWPIFYGSQEPKSKR